MTLRFCSATTLLGRPLNLMQHRICCTSLKLAMALAMCTTASAQGVGAPAHDAQLAAQLARNGTARVTVHLNMPYTPEGALSEAAAQQQRSAIRAAQDAFVKEVVSGTNSQVINRQAWMPALVLDIDAPALARIQRSTRVRAVELDRMMQPAAPAAPTVLPGGPQ